MYNVVIIEDEPLARSKLKRLLQQIAEPIQVIAELSSVSETQAWLSSGGHADLIFSDIELLDGNVFQCYQQQTPPCPVIFITAYDDFMLAAFDSLGIAYLLKPYDLTKLQQAWQKFRLLTAKPEHGNNALAKQLKTLLQHLPSPQASYVTRIPIRQQQQIYFLEVAQILYLQADGNLAGVFTDGDLRRLIEKGVDLRALKASDVMHANPHTIAQSALAVEAAELMELHRITSILVVDDHGRLCGAINSNDLMRAKVI